MHSGTPVIVALLAVTVAGCTPSYDRSATRLEPVAGGFLYHAYADSRHPMDDPRAEARRMATLTSLLTESRLCPAGYGIIKREVGPAKGSGHSARTLRYHGRCK